LIYKTVAFEDPVAALQQAVAFGTASLACDPLIACGIGRSSAEKHIL
jgi:hypothetical protein